MARVTKQLFAVQVILENCFNLKRRGEKKKTVKEVVQSSSPASLKEKEPKKKKDVPQLQVNNRRSTCQSERCTRREGEFIPDEDCSTETPPKSVFHYRQGQPRFITAGWRQTPPPAVGLSQ